MEIKKRENNSPDFYEKVVGFSKKHIFSRKIKILMIVIIFIIGIFFGLLISGFFGTLDKPSPVIISLANVLGIKNFGWQEFFKQVSYENIKIPFNYIKGWFSNPKKIYIDIGFQNYQKLAYHREQALARGFILPEDQEEVPGRVTYQGKTVDVDFRLMGDGIDHIRSEKWSFRITVKKGEKLFGMKSFSIQNPWTRNYVNEFIYHSTLKREGLISLRYEYVAVVVNGKEKGIYTLEESFDKELIENNNRREGPIIRFSEEKIWEDLLQNKPLFKDTKSFYEYVGDKFLELYYTNNIDAFKTTSIIEDSTKSAQFEIARSLLESWRLGKLKTHEVFDTEQLARYFAVATLLGAQHGSQATKIRFYYNPITSRLEPIGYNGYCISNYGVIEEFTPKCFYFSGQYKTDYDCYGLEGYYDSLFNDGVFFEKYIQELERVSEKSYLDSLLKDLDDEIKKNVNMIHKDTPHYHYSDEFFHDNRLYIQNTLNPVKSINPYFDGESSDGESIVLSVGNIYYLPIEILNVVYNDSIYFDLKDKKVVLQPRITNDTVNYAKIEFKTPRNFEFGKNPNLKVNYKIFGSSVVKNESVLPWQYLKESFQEEDFIRKKPNIEEKEFLEINTISKTINIKKGSWILNDSLIIPEGFTVFAGEGTTLDLVNNSTILSYSNFRFSGSKENPIKITSSDKTGNGLVIMKTKKENLFQNVLFEKLTNPSKNNWELTGAITFYEAPFKFDNVIIRGMMAEDSLNGVSSKYEIKNSVFEDCFSDCFDDDFGEGSIESSLFRNSGNDGLDVSGSVVNITNIKISNPGDKGVSVGEKSNVFMSDVEVDGGYICVASKDQSEANIKSIDISNCKYGFAIYQKKAEFGPSSINAINVNVFSIENKYIVERGSNLLVDGKIILGSKFGVYKELYPEYDG